MNRRTIKAWLVSAGTFKRHYFTEYHAEQMGRALALHGMAVTITAVRLPADALTRLIVK